MKTLAITAISDIINLYTRVQKSVHVISLLFEGRTL